MLNSGMQLATKIPDINVQLWAASILKDIYAGVGDQQRQTEAYNMHQNFSQRIYQDQYQASTLHEHSYLQVRVVFILCFYYIRYHNMLN